jgi:hypothetical protein
MKIFLDFWKKPKKCTKYVNLYTSPLSTQGYTIDLEIERETENLWPW